MSGINLEGGIIIEGKVHAVEYEPGVVTGLSTLHLRIKGIDKNVPIYFSQIDEVIEMLQRGKKAIQALEP